MLKEGNLCAIECPNWNQADSVLLVNPKLNGGYAKVSGTSTSYPPDLPTELQAQTMVAMRQQMAYKANSSASLHVVVVLWEVFPTPGRIWVNVYNTSWKGWKSVTLA